MKSKVKPWINIILLIFTLIVNGMGAFGAINGMSQKEISDRYLTLITPSPSTFSIWSVIYAFLIVSIVTMAVKREDDYYARAVDKISYLFWASCVMNIIWIVSFSFELIGLSSIFIFFFLVIMTLIVKQIGKIQTRNRWLLPITFGLYSGWLFIATVVNIAAWLVKIKWSQFGIPAETWSVAILFVSVALTLLVLLKISNAVFPLPIAWAYFGIYNFLKSPAGFNGEYRLLESVSLIGVVLLLLLSVVQFYRNKYRVMPENSIIEN